MSCRMDPDTTVTLASVLVVLGLSLRMLCCLVQQYVVLVDFGKWVEPILSICTTYNMVPSTTMESTSPG